MPPTNGPVTGTVSFFVCYSADSTPDCSTGGDLVSADVAVSGLGTASSDAYAPAHGAGTYCFRAEYSPDADAQYSPTVETNTVINNNDGNNGECFTVAAAPTTQLTLDPHATSVVTVRIDRPGHVGADQWAAITAVTNDAGASGVDVVQRLALFVGVTSRGSTASANEGDVRTFSRVRLR